MSAEFEFLKGITTKEEKMLEKLIKLQRAQGNLDPLPESEL